MTIPESTPTQQKSFGQRLADLRDERGFSQRMLVMKIENRFPVRPLRLRALQKIESGKTEKPTARTLKQLRSIFPSLM